MKKVVRKVSTNRGSSDTPKKKVATSRNYHDTREEALLSIFGHTRYARARATSEMVSYHPAEGELTADLIRQHLEGEIVLGSYSLTAANMVWWLGWDVDSVDLKTAREFASKIISRLEGLPHVVEFSGGKGYHILVFLSSPMPASQAKAIAEFVRDAEGLPKSGKSHVEAYPKQDRLTTSNPLGNLLKIPLGRHPRTHQMSIFVDPSNGWEAGGELNALELLAFRVKPKEAQKLLEGGATDAIDTLAQTLVPVWVSGERHTLALSLSGYLANLGWGLSQVVDLVEKICDLSGDTEVRDRIRTVEDTFQKQAEGKQVAGYMYLAETLPGGIMKSLVDGARMVATPPIMKKVEGIRLAKGPNFQKVRETSDMIWAHLNEVGAVLRTRTDGLFWLDNETKLLTVLDSDLWQALVHKNYGPNPVEAFGRQVMKSLSLKALADGTLVQVHKGSYWDGRQLFVNLGGKEVYVLDGEEVREDYNAECGVIFHTSSDQRKVTTPDWDSDVDAWEYLTDDLSFSPSVDVAATGEEQRELLRAWIMCTFFPQLMETKPILVALGSPGSGKTSTMRRILRILEGEHSDVIALSEDKPDSIRASIEEHKIMVLDNLEKTRAVWLVNMLNILSTGATIELRQLFKTNETYTIEPQVFVALTAVDLPFSESTLHSRLLPLELSPITHIVPESVLQRKIQNARGGIWASILRYLNRAVYYIRETNVVKAPVQSRLADFVVFCSRIVGGLETNAPDAPLDGSLLYSGLMSLVDRQRNQMLQASPVIELMEHILETHPEDVETWMSYGALSDVLNKAAYHKKINLRTSTAASLKRHLDPRWPALVKLWGAEKRTGRDERNRKQEQIRFKKPEQLSF